MRTRPTLNGLQPRTLRDTSRNPHDWICGGYVSNRLSHVLMRHLRALVAWLMSPPPWR